MCNVQWLARKDKKNSVQPQNVCVICQKRSNKGLIFNFSTERTAWKSEKLLKLNKKRKLSAWERPAAFCWSSQKIEKEGLASPVWRF